MVEEDISATVMAGWFSKYWTDKFNENGIKVVFRALIPTVENTKEAIEGGADIIIATGFDDGGTIPEKPISTFSIVHMLVIYNSIEQFLYSIDHCLENYLIV